ncbi:MAG TPA: molybdate ABC transporter substrate-binding protein [Anaeromyxobacter sp.]
MPTGGAAWRLAAFAAAVAAVAASVPHPAGAEEKRVVSVAAAANLRAAMAELAKAFEQAHPGVKVQVTLGASGALFSQIRSAGPFDVFFSADRELPRRLIEARLAGPEVVYAVGRLVIWTRPGSPLSFERAGLAGLSARGVSRIAIANPASAPYGRAAIAAFQAAGIAQAIQGRLVLGQSVAQAAQFAQSGAADVAILPASLAGEPALATGKAVLVPQSLHPRLEQSAVVLSRATEPALAGAFLVFVTGMEGRAILQKYRYELP